jgi:uncharacterized membrane protein
MVRHSRLLVLNVIIFILLIMQASAGLWLWSLDLRDLEPPRALITTHLMIGLTLTTLVLVHIYMNRRWVRTQLLGDKSS